MNDDSGKKIIRYKGRDYYQEETETELILTSVDKYSGRTIILFLDKLLPNSINKEEKA